MFYMSYVLSELRRRSGRTLLTALGLAVGIALVVTVNALSTGLDHAQASVLAPLTGLGTDMSVTRPLRLSATGGDPFANLSPSERAQLIKENGGGRFGLRNIAKPGQHFNDDRFTSTSELTFPASEVSKVASLPGVEDASGSLTLTDLHISGTVPKNLPSQPASPGQQGSGGFRVGPGGDSGGRFFGPSNINVNSQTVTGFDPAKADLAPISPSQITSGRFIRSGDGSYVAILSTAYARLHNLSVGSTITLGGKTFRVIGLAAAPLGGTSSDVYVKLSTLQSMSSRAGRVNTMQVRATSAGMVGTVQHEISSSFSGAQVTTAKDLANRIGGSLTDVKNLSTKLGTALEIVGLLAAVLIAVLLTLASVAKRTREIGTLRAIGWSQGLVVRQISLESLLHGAIGGVIGAALGIAAALVIDGMGVTLKATVANAAQPTGPFGFGRFGQAAASSTTSGSTLVHINAPTDLTLIVAAIGLAVLGGLIAGTIGGLRAARLRPASALRTVE
ncbi:MAG TPA: ABC transporter permease [Chloroflexota bacterium]